MNLSNTGDTQIQLGESGDMTNFYITSDLKLRKIMGYKSFNQFKHSATVNGATVELEDPIDAMYPVKLGNTEYLLVAANKKLYYFLKSDLDSEWAVPTYDDGDNPLSTQWRTISNIQVNDRGSTILTEARWVAQNKLTKTTRYQVRVWYVCVGTNAEMFDAATIVSDGLGKNFIKATFKKGKTKLLEINKEIAHPNDGSAVTHNVTTTWTTNGQSYSTTASITLKHIDFGPSSLVIPTYIGDLGAGKVSFFTFDKKVYILSGKYQSWDGTTLKEVEGYTPLVFINTPPAGGGVIYDEINMLSPKKHQTFNGDGTSTTYYLAQNRNIVGTDLTSIDKVLIDDVEVPSTNYTVSLTQGTVTFNTAPPVGMDNVDIYWSVDDGDRNIIENMQYGTIFGGDLDIRVFVYGNPLMPNRTYFSGLVDGVPSVEYFPATAQVDVGPSNFALTDLTRQYDRLLATTNKPEAYYLTISTEKLPITLTDNSQTTRYVPSVGTFPLNEAHGNMAMGQGQLIDNYPVTMDSNGLSLWKATNVRDEKNMEEISQKISIDLDSMDMAAMKSLDFQLQRQLWFGYDHRFYIYNYANKTFSRIEIPDSFTCYTVLGDNVYMGFADGRVARWDTEFKKFDDEPIDAHWEMNFSDFDAVYLRKTMRKVWVLMQPQSHASAIVGFITNSKESNIKKRIEYQVRDFDDIDFGDFSFQLSYNTKPFKLKMKAKKFTNLKLTIDNEEETDCTILQLVINIESFGESK